MDKDIINKDIKIKYIYDKVTNHSINSEYIKSFIDLYEIKFTENMNGIFINLSILDETIIDKFYIYIKDNLNNGINKERFENIKIAEEIINNPKKRDIKNKKIYTKRGDLTELELRIIKLSKTI